MKRRGKCVVDSAFSRGQYPFLIKSAQDHVMGSDGTEASILTLWQATSARKESEWWMRAFQGTFIRLNGRLRYEERGVRKIVLLSILILFNLRARLVGINHILTSYMPHLRVEANKVLLLKFRFLWYAILTSLIWYPNEWFFIILNFLDETVWALCWCYIFLHSVDDDIILIIGLELIIRNSLQMNDGLIRVL